MSSCLIRACLRIAILAWLFVRNAAQDAPLDQKWAITLPTFEGSDGLTLVLEWQTSNYVGDSNVQIEIYDPVDCNTAVGFTETQEQVSDGAPFWGPQVIIGTGDPQNSDGLGSRTYRQEVNINPVAIENAATVFRYEGATLGKGVIEFCSKLSLSTGSTLVNWLEASIVVFVDLTDGFQIEGLDLSAKDKILETELLTYGVTASFCYGNPPQDVADSDAALLYRGGVLQVCVRPSQESIDFGLGMRRIDRFSWIRTDPVTGGVVEQSVIVGGAAANALSILDCPESGTGEVCSFTSIVKADFYQEQVAGPTPAPTTVEIPPTSGTCCTGTNACFQAGGDVFGDGIGNYWVDDYSCIGTRACEGIASDGGSATIADRSCAPDPAEFDSQDSSDVDAENVCWRAGSQGGDISVGDRSCLGEAACQEIHANGNNETAFQAGSGTCVGYQACIGAGSNGGADILLSDGACVGSQACLYMADGVFSPSGPVSPDGTATVGMESCVGNEACSEVARRGGDVTIGEESCRGNQACLQVGFDEGVPIQIGDGSCNCASCCKCLEGGDIVPDNQCNSIGTGNCCLQDGSIRNPIYPFGSYLGTVPDVTIAPPSLLDSFDTLCFSSGADPARRLEFESAEAERQLQNIITIGGEGEATLRFNTVVVQRQLRRLQEEEENPALGGKSFEMRGNLVARAPSDTSDGSLSRYAIDWSTLVSIALGFIVSAMTL